MTVLAMVISVLELSIPPPVPIAGFKWGLSNSVILMVLFMFGPKEAFIVAVLKVFLSSVITGRFLTPSFFLGMGGALSSVYVMSILLKRKFGLIAISVFGSFISNCVQLMLAAFVFVNSSRVLLLSGYIIGIGAMTGAANALIFYGGIKWLKKASII